MSKSNDIIDTTHPKEKIEEIGDLEDGDNGSVLVIILQCETKSCDENITALKWVFSDPYFTVQVVSVDPPADIPVSKTLTRLQYQENYFMRKALNYAAEGPYIDGTPQFWWSKIPVIIVKDSSISNITPSGKSTNKHKDPIDDIIQGMKQRIKVSLDKAKQADLFYLCKWNDLCNKYTEISGTALKWSVQPTATQAIMYTPKSRDYISNALLSSNVTLGELLNNDIRQGKLAATVFVPNIIDFDITLATSANDYLKLNECDIMSTSTGTTGTTNASTFVWFIVIILLILFIAWAIIQLGPGYIATNPS